MLKRHVLLGMAWIVLAASVASADFESEIAKVMAEIKSGDKVRMTQAKQEVERVRSQIVSLLSAILAERDESQISLQWAKRDSPRNVAIELLGKMRAEEAIDLLIANLAPPGGTTTSWPFHSYPPAIDALARIGKAATTKIIEKMTTCIDQEILHGLGLALIQIESFEGGKELLDNRIGSERDETRRKKLETVRERYLKLPKTLPPPGYDD